MSDNIEISDIMDGNISVPEAAGRKFKLRAIKDRAAALEKSYDRYLDDKLDSGESLNVVIDGQVYGRLEKTRGNGSTDPRVKDKLALANWLHSKGYDDDVYPVPYPKETALKKAFLEKVIEETGELPDGVEMGSSRGPQLRLTTDKSKVAEIWQRSTLPESQLLLDNGGEL
ncbi:hypothetical protein [Bifidobacterium oedipodis]|uniref:Uncharacterized protein n=1 Tax=Bifidobacterium oedipodis TaxID=2675322 RepID=A0A7Y0EPA7_9BIFI|nr:hypothetical protein [Bifidobacterium sp. DSM 109957]NMM93936.1 hypothetical protein [Bifidobacterium sp. DSM 109957]